MDGGGMREDVTVERGLVRSQSGEDGGKRTERREAATQKKKVVLLNQTMSSRITHPA